MAPILINSGAFVFRSQVFESDPTTKNPSVLPGGGRDTGHTHLGEPVAMPLQINSISFNTKIQTVFSPKRNKPTQNAQL